MVRLTKEEAQEQVIEEKPSQGIKGVNLESLMSIDLDSVPDLITDFKQIDGFVIENKDGERFKYDAFTPRVGSIYFKPSFAGRQILMGKTGRVLRFSNGRWFGI